MSLIVVTGTDGAGKTTLSRIIASALSYRTVNIGDEMLSLLPLHLSKVPRTSIGSAFLETFGEGAYLRLVRRLAGGGTVLDGVRLASGLRELRSMPMRLVHVHRESPPGANDLEEQPYRVEADHLRAAADVVMPWCDDTDQLAYEASRLLVALIGSEEAPPH